MRFALPVVIAALLAPDALAQKIAILPFTGPGANAARNQVVGAVCDLAECAAQQKVSAGGKPDWKKAKKEKVKFFVTGKVTAKGKKKTLELQVLSKPGKPKWKKSFPLEKDKLSTKNFSAASEGLVNAMGLEGKAPDEKKPPPDEKKPPPEEKKPPPEEKKPPPEEVKPPPEERKPVPPEETPPPVVGTPTTQTKRPVFAVEVGLDLQGKSYSYSQVATPNLRSYRAPFILAPDLKGELYPLALAQQGFIAGLGLELGFSFAVGLKSRRTGTDLTYPTSISKLDVALKFQIRPLSNSDAFVAPFLGYRSHSFSVGAASDGSTLDGLPAISYSALKIGVGGELPFGNTGLLLYGRFALLPVLSANNIIGKEFFAAGSVLGLDGALGLGFKLPPLPALQIRLGFDFARYGLTFKTNPTDVYVAEGAVDQYLGGNLAVRFTY